MPVICMYGETDSKKTVMVYVHNYFPYFYIPSSKHKVDDDTRAVISILSGDSRLHGGSTRSYITEDCSYRQSVEPIKR